MSKWYSLGGADNDVILYSKVRLARNLSDTPFKNKLSPDQAQHGKKTVCLR